MPEIPLTLTEAAAALRSGEVTSETLTRTMLARADRLDPQLGTWMARFDDEALAAAAGADADLVAGIDRGPLQGIPIGIKDILAMSEGPTTAQSLILDPAWGAGKDAPVVARLKAAGAILTGKLTTMEFAIGMPDEDKPFPLPRNPWDTDTWPGGSSSGTGSAVATGQVYAGIGTDTGGSIRIPAAYCGTTGLMPTFGRVPKSGCVPLGYSLDHIGPLARSARDCGSFLAAIAGYHPSDPSAVEMPVPDFLAGADGSLAGLRIGVDRSRFGIVGPNDDPRYVEVFEAAVTTLADLGAVIVDVTIPHYEEGSTAAIVTMCAEALAYHRQDLQSRWADYFAKTREMVAQGALASAADYVQAQRVRRLLQSELGALFNQVDLVATPTATTGAPAYGDLGRRGVRGLLRTVHTAYWDGVGNPVLVAPMGFTSGSLPLSLQLAARPFEEALLVRAADAYQQATDWHLAVPPIAASVPSAA